MTAIVYSTFISHSGYDKDLAMTINFNLIANNAQPWIDSREIGIGDLLEETLRAGFNQSASFLFLASENSLNPMPDYVRKELDWAKARKFDDPNFRVLVLLQGSDTLLPDWLKRFVYSEMNESDPQISIGKVVETITGSASVLDSLQSFFFSPAGEVNSRVKGNLWDSVIRHNLQRLAQIKSLLRNPGFSEEEIRSTLKTLQDVSLFRDLPVAQAFWTQTELGVYEAVFPVRMRVAPTVTIHGLPREYEIRLLEVTPIHCRLEVVNAKTQERVQHAVPLSQVTEFNAEL